MFVFRVSDFHRVCIVFENFFVFFRVFRVFFVFFSTNNYITYMKITI